MPTTLTSCTQAPADTQLGWLQINPEVKVGDLLTPITVFITVMTFLWTIRKDIRAARGVEVDKVRGAASRALGKLERWKEVALWFYQEIQPLFVETSNLLSKEYDVDKTRDHLWVALSVAHIKNSERLLGESLETAYVELAAYYPGVYDAFGQTIHLMKSVAESLYNDMLLLSQSAVTGLRNTRATYTPPLLGNQLREMAGVIRQYLNEELEHAWGPIREFLVETINKKDEELLQGKQCGIKINVPKDRKYPSLQDFADSRRKVLRDTGLVKT